MSNSNKNIWIALIVVAIIAISGLLFPKATQNALGRVGTAFPNGLCVGSNCSSTQGAMTTGASGTAFTQVNGGTCDLAALASEYPTIMVASSTAIFTCSATGVVAGDKVMVNPGLYPTGSATTTWSAFGLGSFTGVKGIRFVSASSTAANTISVELANQTGVATSSFIQATSTWSWWSFR